MKKMFKSLLLKLKGYETDYILTRIVNRYDEELVQLNEKISRLENPANPGKLDELMEAKYRREFITKELAYIHELMVEHGEYIIEE